MSNEIFFPFFRASDQVLLLHREEEHSGLRSEGNNAFLGQLRQGQFAIGTGKLISSFEQLKLNTKSSECLTGHLN